LAQSIDDGDSCSDQDTDDDGDDEKNDVSAHVSLLWAIYRRLFGCHAGPVSEH
jgi:hypothetical protein